MKQTDRFACASSILAGRGEVTADGSDTLIRSIGLVGLIVAFAIAIPVTLAAAEAVTPQPLFQLLGNVSEVTGVRDGSIVTPTIAPIGFRGTVSVNGGSVNFGPNGNGVYFLNCCGNTNNAWYEFAGTTIGEIFDSSKGQISFNVTSRYSFAERAVAAHRWVFDVRDDSPTNHWFYVYYEVVEVQGQRYLAFTYRVGGIPSAVSSGYAGQYYFVPKGMEDTLFGKGVKLKVTVKWGGSIMQLYLNDVLVKSTKYVPGTPNWTANSRFNFGGYEYLNVGVYEVTDDVISDFTVE
jgi:hypothetical protein